MYKQGFFLTDIIEDILPEGGTDTYPQLDERVRDWFIIGTAAGKSIIHVIDINDKMNRLREDTTFLERSYRHIATDAKQGNVNCRVVIDEIAFTNWEIDNPGEGPPRISYRGKFKEWKIAGKPIKLTGWLPAHVIFGQGIELPEDDEIED